MEIEFGGDYEDTLEGRKFAKRPPQVIIGDNRYCWGCHTVLPFEDFYGNPKVTARCKPCTSAELKDRWENDPEYREREAERRRQNKGSYYEKYGITLAEFDDLCESQGGCCAICGEEKRLVADHCHDEGHFRGAICHRCNMLMGYVDEFHRNPELFERALIYKHNSGP